MKAAPAPIVSGRYFFPKAPLLCLKWMPAWAVTSVNSIGPDGRGGVGLGDGDAAASCSAGELDVGATVAGCLQEVSKRATHTRRGYLRQRGIIITEKFHAKAQSFRESRKEVSKCSLQLCGFA